VATSLQGLLDELEAFGSSNDHTTTDRSRRMLNITRDTGEFLLVQARATRAQRILEIGTSNGYSTLWLAMAADATGGHVTTVESSDYKIALAANNFQRSGLNASILLIHREAGAFLEETPAASFDLLFLDSDRTRYAAWWPHIRRVIHPGGLLVVDNAVSHVDEMRPFVSLVEADPEFASCTVPVGKGEFLATRAAGPISS
jgi:predicted O-methyltransferase YrrM